MTKLRIDRPGTPGTREPSATYSATVPRFGGRPTSFQHQISEIDATTLVQPSRWERVWLASLAADTGASIAWPDESTGQHVLSAALTSSGVDGWQVVPDGVVVRRAATRRGEARAAIGDIRQWLRQQGRSGIDAARACDEVLILLPGRAELFALWQRELALADIPTQSNHFESIGVHSVARWVVALSELRQWATEPVPREHLRSVLEPRFWSQAAVLGEGAGEVKLRKVLRELLTTIR